MSVKIKDIQPLVGCKVFVTLLENKQTFEGLLYKVSEKRDTFLLRQVSGVPSDGRCFEQLELNIKEIENIHTLSEDKSKNEETTSPSSIHHASFFNEQFFENLKEKAERYIHLKEINKDFYDALKSINGNKLIAVMGEGTEEGRFGLMGILSIYTGSSVYLLDVINIGEQIFHSKGCTLKKILESNEILKVVHNCRLLSDNLFHKYNVKLTNVYDTQVCYSLIQKNKLGSFPLEAVTLSTLLSKLFDLPEGICREVQNSDEWRRGPLTSELMNTAALRVAFLLPSRRVLENLFHAPFDELCELYTQVVRTCDLLEARTNMERDKYLPKEVTDLSKV